MSDHGFSLDPRHVEGNLFTETGKWKYTVLLDYTDVEWDDWNLREGARKALRDATEKEISGVILKEIPWGWTLVVLNPYAKNSHPIMARRDSE